MQRFLLVLISLFLIIPPLTQAGKLSDFEESATSNENDNKAPEPQEEDDDDDDDDQYYYEDEDDGNDYEDSTYGSNSSSSQRIHTRAAAPSRRRSSALYTYHDTAGKPRTPRLRLDLAHQEVDSDVKAVDWRFEAGLDWAGFNYNQVSYGEEDTNDELDLSYFHAVYRHTFSAKLEWQVGGGMVSLSGQEENSGASFTSPILYRPLDWLAVEFRPTWSSINDNSIRDYDLGIYFGRRYTFLKAGYRWVQSGDSDLDAAYIGVSLRY